MVNESENGVDGRVSELPGAAVNLAARLAHLANHKRKGTLVKAEIIITDENLILFIGGKSEYLGTWRKP